MKLRNPSLLRTSVVAASLLLTATAFAQQKSPFYAGFGVGAAMTDGDYSGQVFLRLRPWIRFCSALTALRSTMVPALGARFTPAINSRRNSPPNLATPTSAAAVPVYEVFGSTANYFVRGDFKASGVSLDLVGRLPVAKDLSLNARVGVMETSLKYSDSDGFSAPNTRQARLHLGVGAAWRFAPNMAATLDYQRERCRQDLCVDGDGHQSEWAPELQPHFCGFAFRLLGHHRWQVRGVAHRSRNFC
jgi:hypothetical protein